MLILWILLGFLILCLLPPVIMFFFPIANLLMRVLLTFTIFTTVRSYLGAGNLTLLISGVLIYLLVIKWGYMTASLYVFFYVLMAFNFLAVIVWGTNTVLKKH
ncbi:MAG: hypothetical protein V1493_06585 [Candidatus Diapherotrites archaeon]